MQNDARPGRTAFSDLVKMTDLINQSAKVLKYLGFEAACNTMFVAFLTSWVVARHGIYNFLCWSIYRDVPRVMPFGCHNAATESAETDPTKLSSRWRYAEPFLDQNGTICLDKSVKSVFLGLLMMLQVLSIAWFILIVKVAIKLVRGDVAQDTRSSDEEEEEEETVETGISKEQDDCREAASNGKAAYTPSGKARASSTEATPPRQTGLFQRGTGRLRVPGSRDRKELIGRVGCNG